MKDGREESSFFVCSYLKYPCNDESFALANAIRVVYEFATGRRLNPTLPKRFLLNHRLEDNTFDHRSDSVSNEQTTAATTTTTNRVRSQSSVPIHPAHISPEELQFIQNTLPTWLTEVEAKCASKHQRFASID